MSNRLRAPLELTNVKTILGHFKGKDRKCPACKHVWLGHEEKETDVNIALHLLDAAHRNAFDRALLITNDSDLVPAIKMVRNRFPEKRITAVTPPNHRHSNELIKASSEKARITVKILERSLFPSTVHDASRIISVARPPEYSPKTVPGFATI